MNVPKVISNLLRREEVISILAIGKVICRQIGSSVLVSIPGVARIFVLPETYPDMMISSSTPYSFMCCSPQPSLMRLGMYFLRKPVRFGVWYMRISTRSDPNSATSGASSDAHDGFGASLVPRRQSVRMLSLTFGLLRRDSCKVSMSSRSDFPMYSVDRKMRLLAFCMRSYTKRHVRKDFVCPQSQLGDQLTRQPTLRVS